MSRRRFFARPAPLPVWCSGPKSVLSLSIPLLLVLLTGGCGKRVPPQPPIERVQQRTELLSGGQRGNQVILSWPAPVRNAPNSSVQSIRRVDVYRLAEKPTAPLALTEEEFGTRSTLIGSVTFEEIKEGKDTLTYIDRLELAGEPTRLRYAVSYVNQAGQHAAFSNFLLIEPAAHVAQPPRGLGFEVAENGITIRWEPPTANTDSSTPVNLLGYNVYRLEESQTDSSQTPINNGLVSGNQFVDKNFKFGQHYRYIVRAASLGTEGAQVESLNSDVVSVTPRDIFPPSTPADPRIVAAPGRISIFFAPNPESDVAGYNVYRSTDPNRNRPWTKLTSTLLTKNTFTDPNVESGKTYYYYITAVDTSGNESNPSEIASETVP